MSEWADIADALGIKIAELEMASGGCINTAATITTPGGGRLFVKANAADKLPMFEAEAEALVAIAATGTIRVPPPVAYGVAGGRAYLALDHIELGAPGPRSWEKMGESLAALHGHLAADGMFGWGRDNVIGETHQPNQKEESWSTFFREHRLRHQFELASEKGYRFEESEKLLEKCGVLLGGHRPSPALLHGDLWSGNAAFDKDGDPVIYDPATYYGDPETDLAFTEMFGGFNGEFYRAYDAAMPPAEGRDRRKSLYNLYHLLNHANLFGGGYVASARACIRGLLS